MGEEEKTEVKVFMIHRKCAVCKDGKMIYTGQAFQQFDTTYDHKCNKCGEMDYFVNKKYPHTAYESV